MNTTDAIIKTSHGEIAIRLDADKAPITTRNFLAYVAAGHYEGTVFHRVIPGFMIQGGGMDAGLTRRPTRPPIQIESQNGLKNLRGTIAMARTGDPNSATAQFFINVADNGPLDYRPGPGGEGYTVFAEVTAGMDVVAAIEGVATSPRGGHRDVPVEPVTIESIQIRA